jgi:hypothetical protein
MGNPCVDLFFIVLQEVIFVNDLHQSSASATHVVTSFASAVSNCNTHKCCIARRQEKSIRPSAMSIAKNLMWLTSLTAGRNALITVRVLMWSPHAKLPRSAPAVLNGRCLSRRHFARSTCTWTVSNIPRLTKTLRQSYNDGMVNLEVVCHPSLATPISATKVVTEIFLKVVLNT